ncbi:DUF4434 domain-containing protein [Pseudomonas sp. zfem002]|uniref:DUF4434 domain-containing protein n=1 Tax=Pseudomonas sp. zfem002 TaxID=3078197 RepID=UPI00292849E2|nr:DUF4434 domain-containing protein [Pseudomonas sp. zfem002]MDU9392960.1 DUF4434 domain-containing protein [Pseudomonas sp. zfem002]
MRRILLVLLFACLPAVADQRVIYQPLNRDAVLSAEQWRQLWADTVRNGGRTLIVQWTRYGDERFGGADGWLASSLRLAHEQGLELVLGLHLDSAYYTRIDELDSTGLAAYWKVQLGESLAQQREVRTWKLPVAGWYLPMELDDVHFWQEERRAALFTQLQEFNRKLDAPLHLSAFSAGRLAPGIQSEWFTQLAGLGLKLWWQDGEGTGRLPAEVREHYANVLPCEVGIIREAFRQVSKDGEPFRAVPMKPGTGAGCHAEAVFALNYRPWAKVLPSAPR